MIDVCGSCKSVKCIPWTIFSGYVLYRQKRATICSLINNSFWGCIYAEMCWHEGFSPVWPLQSYLSPPPLFHSFGLLQKITTITVTVIRLCVFCVLCHLHKWFIFVLAWAQPNPHLGLHHLVAISAPSASNVGCLTVNETVFTAAFLLLCDRPYKLPEFLVVSLNSRKTSFKTTSWENKGFSKTHLLLVKIIPSTWKSWLLLRPDCKAGNCPRRPGLWFVFI